MLMKQFRQQRKLNIPVNGALRQERLECYMNSCILTQLFNCFHLSEQIHLSEQTFVRCVQRCSDNRGCTVHVHTNGHVHMHTHLLMHG